MPFATAKEKARVRELLAGLGSRDRMNKATELARIDWENGKRGVAGTDRYQSTITCDMLRNSLTTMTGIVGTGIDLNDDSF